MVVVGVLGAVVAGAGPQTARIARAYGPGPQNLWTQMNNTFWEGNHGGDPNCYSSCVQWPYGPNGYFQGTWATDITTPGWFVSDIQQAVADASSLPFNSPSWTDRPWSGSCSSVDLCLHLASPPIAGDFCGVTSLPGSGTITYAEIDIPPGQHYEDHPTTDGTCDLRNTMHHELGHALGLGHSSSGESVMWYQDNGVENFGTNEHHGLKVIYLDHNDNWTGGNQACPGCQEECYAAMQKLGSGQLAPSLDLSGVCGEAGLPVPRVGTPVLTPGGVGQKGVVTVDGYVQTVRSRVP